MSNVVPFPGVILTARETGEPPERPPVPDVRCPVCVYSTVSDHPVVKCDRCGAEHHEPCFWRGLSLDEWLAYLRWVHGTDERDREMICAACRPAGDA
jgi:hypothetical protein